MTVSDPFIIRPAQAGDRTLVLALVPRLRAFGPPPLRPPEALDAGEQRALDQFFDAPPDGASLWVAEGADGAILGAAYAEQAVDYFTQESHGHLAILAVAAAAEGRGVGRALITAVEQWAAERGYRFLALNVFATNERAIAVYERAGYQLDTVRYVKELRAVLTLAWLLILAPVLALTVPRLVGAQSTFPASLEVSVGAARLVGGPQVISRDGVAADALLGLRLRPNFAGRPGGGVVAAISAAMQGPIGTGDGCRLSPDGGCVPNPSYYYIASALVGWENRTGSVRALTGPASVQEDGGGRAFGLQARLDGATPPFMHVAAVLSLRGTLVPNYRGNALGLTALGLGLRLR